MYFRHIIIALSLLGASCTLPTQDSVAIRGIAPRSLPNMEWDDSLPDAEAPKSSSWSSYSISKLIQISIKRS
ncbi:uncharacterized protein LW93_1527 [Fusarium fujikuroi]|nr:uncharacterized protein LW93_1527 [Fusarium fujikuroi]